MRGGHARVEVDPALVLGNDAIAAEAEVVLRPTGGGREEDGEFPYGR